MSPLIIATFSMAPATADPQGLAQRGYLPGVVFSIPAPSMNPERPTEGADSAAKTLAAGRIRCAGINNSTFALILLSLNAV